MSFLSPSYDGKLDVMRNHFPCNYNHTNFCMSNCVKWAMTKLRSFYNHSIDRRIIQIFLKTVEPKLPYLGCVYETPAEQVKAEIKHLTCHCVSNLGREVEGSN